VDLDVSREDELFRQEVKQFLRRALKPNLKAAGRKMTTVFSDFGCALEWQQILHAKGWLALDWPSAYGGTGWSLDQRNIFQEESKRAGAPSLLPFGVQMLGPILIRYGTEEQKKVLLPRILSGEDLWCQGYSEPGAGSDLASLKTRAIKEGSDYIVSGSKIWTSFAQYSNKIFCLVRTDLKVKPQAGISFLLIDLDSPGIVVDPIVSIDGEVEQCQVFFEDVRVPVDHLVGEENQGWEIAKYLLEFERGGYSYFIALNKQIDLIKNNFRDDTEGKRHLSTEEILYEQRLAELEIDKLALEYLELRIKASARAGSNPGPLSSMAKLVSAHVMNSYLNNRASTIYGGSAEIQRNIIAKVVLGL